MTNAEHAPQTNRRTVFARIDSAPVRKTVGVSRNGGAVKSAARVLAILEYFDQVRRPATEIEIAVSLGMPQSSTSALLHTMSDLGYLRHDPYSRTYSISERVSLLGSWRETDVVKPGRILGMMEELRAETNQTVCLVQHHGPYVQFIHVIKPHAETAAVPTGCVRPVCTSATGPVFLSSANDAEVTRIVNRNNADAETAARTISPQTFKTLVGDHRARGYAFTNSLYCKGFAAIAAAVPGSSVGPNLAVSLNGGAEEFERNRESLARALLRAIDRTFGSNPQGRLPSASGDQVSRRHVA